jgi:hypothetical protein
MEHASVAAFARFSLELLSVGSPPALLEETARAMSDEIAHARLCFALAGAYAGKPIGPGRLAVDGSLERASRQSPMDAMIAKLVREGCIGETLAAIEAREAKAWAADPAVSDVLGRIADDEARHAALAWRTLAWAIESGGVAARRTALREMAKAFEEHAATQRIAAPGERADLAPHGILGANMRSALALRAMDVVVRPVFEALVATCDAGEGHTGMISTSRRAAVARARRSFGSLV